MATELWQPVEAVAWLSLMICGLEQSLAATGGSQPGLSKLIL